MTTKLPGFPAPQAGALLAEARRMPSPSTLSLLLVGLLAACSRRVPDAPPSSPLSHEAASAPAPRVDVAMTSDPPLPGESREGWAGLPAAKAGGHQHHGHHGHAASPSKAGAHGH
jgi:hypothetical protein